MTNPTNNYIKAQKIAEKMTVAMKKGDNDTVAKCTASLSLLVFAAHGFTKREVAEKLESLAVDYAMGNMVQKQAIPDFAFEDEDEEIIKK